jgi:hypothetical protein
MMAVNKDELLKWFQYLPETEQKTVIDFVHFLASKQSIDLQNFYVNVPEVDESFSDEELRQINSGSGFVKWEDAKKRRRYRSV